jgi:hypothetical protein
MKNSVFNFNIMKGAPIMLFLVLVHSDYSELQVRLDTVFGQGAEKTPAVIVVLEN